MIAPRTTTPATIRTLLSSLSELLRLGVAGLGLGVGHPTTVLVASDNDVILFAVACVTLTGGAGLGTRGVRRRGPRSAPGSGRAGLQVRGHRLDLAHHAQDVAAGEPREVVLRPAALGQRGEQRGVGRDVLEPVGQHLDAVVVAAEPDVVDPGHLAHVLAVRHHVGERRRAAAGGRATRRPRRRRTVRRPPRGCPPPPRPPPSRGAVGAGGVHELRHEGHHAHAAAAGHRLQHVVGGVARAVGHRPRRAVAEDHRRLGDRRARRASCRPRRGRGRPSSRPGSSPARPRGRTPSARRRPAGRWPSRPRGCSRCG